MSKLSEYLSGQSEPSNEYAKYIVASIKDLAAEHAQVSKDLQAGRDMVNQLMTKMVQLEAVLARYQKDLEVFDK